MLCFANLESKQLIKGVPAAVPVDTTMIYNISSNVWEYDTSRVAIPRSDCCMAAVDGKLYLAGLPWT